MSEPFDPHLLLADLAFARRLARSLARDDASADDLVQEGFHAMLERPPRHGSNLRGYWSTLLRRIARRRRRTEARRAARERWAARPEPQPATSEEAARAEAHRRLVAAVLALDEPYRRTLLGHYLEERTLPQLATREEVSLETVRTRLKRGLAILRRRLDAEPGRRGEWLAVLLPGGGASSSGPAPSVASPRLPRWLPARRIPTSALALGTALTLGVVAAARLLSPPGADRAGDVSPESVVRAAAEEARPAPAGASEAAARHAVAAAAAEPAPRATPFDVAGRVRDGEGRPLEGVRVTARAVWWDGAQEVGSGRTGADGRFGFDAPRLAELAPLQRRATSLSVSCVAPGFHPASRLEALPNGPVDRDVVLARGRVASGRVLDAGGRPIAGVHVHVRTAARGADGAGRDRHVETDGEGVYRVGLDAGEDVVSARVDRGELGSGVLDAPARGAADAEPALPDLVVLPLRSLRGRVVFPGGAPVADADVEARRVALDPELGAWTWGAAAAASEERDDRLPGTSLAHALTDSDGAFEILGLRDGRYLVTTRWDLAEPPCAPDAPVPEESILPSGSESCVLVHPGARVRVAVRDADGHPLRSIEVDGCFLDANGVVERRGSMRAFGEDAEAVFDVPRRPEGEALLLVVDLEGLVPVEERVELPPGVDEVRREIVLRELDETGALRIAVRSPDGGPAPEWLATFLSTQTSFPVEGLRDLAPSSAGWLEGLPPGSYRVIVRPRAGAGGFERDTWLPDAVEIEPGGRTEVEASFRIGGRLGLRFVEARSGANASAGPELCPAVVPAGEALELRLHPADAPPGSGFLRARGAVPDAEGGYELPRPVPPGRYLLRVLSGARLRAEREVSIEAGRRVEEVVELEASR